jgi:hypothetical protein
LWGIVSAVRTRSTRSRGPSGSAELGQPRWVEDQHERNSNSGFLSSGHTVTQIVVGRSQHEHNNRGGFQSSGHGVVQIVLYTVIAVVAGFKAQATAATHRAAGNQSARTQQRSGFLSSGSGVTQNVLLAMIYCPVRFEVGTDAAASGERAELADKECSVGGSSLLLIPQLKVQLAASSMEAAWKQHGSSMEAGSNRKQQEAAG